MSTYHATKNPVNFRVVVLKLCPALRMSNLTNQNVHYMFSIVKVLTLLLRTMWLLLQIMYSSTKGFYSTTGKRSLQVDPV